MSLASVTGITAASSLVVGGALALWSSSTLQAEGTWSAEGLSSGRLDFTTAALLMVGVALLITGVIMALAALTEFWIDRQDLRDAQLQARDERTAVRDARIAASLAETQPHSRSHSHLGG